MRCIDINNRLLEDKEYCYHGCTTKQDCGLCGAKESIYKDTMRNAFCIKCHQNTEW